MSEQTQGSAATAAAPPVSVTPAQAATMLAERRAQAASGGNTVSDAARALGQRSAQARQERQAQAATQTQETTQVEGGDVKDDPTQSNGESETLNETANGESPNESQTEGKTEPDGEEPQTIELGEGLTLTLDEIRDGIMMKADHTRKTMSLAEDRKQLEAFRTQKLDRLDKIVSTLEQKIGKPKTLGELIKEYGREDALDRLAEQEEEQSRIKAAQTLRDTQKRELMSEREQARDKYLAENYKKEWADETKRDAAYTDLTGYALKLGADPSQVPELVYPWMIMVLDKARAFDALEANKGAVTKTIAAVPKVVRPGAKVSAQASAFSAVQAAQAKLKSSGSLADAVALLRANRGMGR